MTTELITPTLCLFFKFFGYVVFLTNFSLLINAGLEAPRNSLELDEPVAERKSVSSSLSSSSTMKVDEQNLNIPVSQIVTVTFIILLQIL